MIDYEGWDKNLVYPLEIASKLWFASENQVDLRKAPQNESNRFYTLLNEAILVGQLKVEDHHWSTNEAGKIVPEKVTWYNLINYFRHIGKNLPEFLWLPISTSFSLEQDPEESQTEKLEEFIRNLRVWCDNGTEIKIQQPGKKTYTANNDNLGFSKTTTKEWKALTAVLKNSKHIIYYDKTMHTEKQMFLSIEKKLLKSFSKILEIEFPKGFKLVESIKGETGQRRFKFRITPCLEKVCEDYSNYDENRILKEIKKIADFNGHPADYIAAVKRAEELGISDDEINRIITNSQAIQDTAGYGSVVDKFENQSNEDESGQY